MTKPYKCRVEYLESTGTQYIDTEYVMSNDNMTFNGNMMWTQSQGNANFFYGYRSVNTAEYRGDMRSFFIYGASPGGRLAIRYGVNADNSTSVAVSLNTKFNIAFDGANLKVNGTTYATLTQAYTPANYKSMWLFNCNTTGYYSADVNHFIGRIYNWQIKQDGVLVRDFIPVLDNSGRPAMYDQVSGQLFYNQGSGDDFSYGRQIIPVEYLESTGTQYIDTGLKGKNNIDFDYKCIFTNIDGTAQCVGGNWSGQPLSYVSLYLGLIRANGNFAYHYDGTQSPVVVMNTTIQDTPYSIQGHMWTGEQYMVINGTKSSVGTISSTFTSSLNMYLFGINNNELSNPAYMKLYYCKIYDNGVLVRDFIPCIDENLTPFMFDKVNNTVYLNAGTGQFKVGPNVEKTLGVKKLRRKLALALANLKKQRKYYCEVEYLESSGTQWIDTGISGNNPNLKIEVNATTYEFGWMYNNNASGSWVCAFTFPTENRERVNYGNYNQLVKTFDCDRTVRKKRVFDFKSGFYVDDVLIQAFTIENYSLLTPSLSLFARYDFYDSQYKVIADSSYKIYSAKIFDGNNLVRDFIPVLDWNYVPCMYDKVTETLFYNQGTGSFTYGREIHYVDYLESTGTQYIDTGVNLTSNHSVEIDYQLTVAIQSRTGLFGILDGSTSSPRFGALISPSGNALESGYGTTNVYYQIGLPGTNRHVLKQEKNKLYYDGVLIYTFGTATFTTNTSSPLGNFKYTNYVPASAKYYSSKWWDNDTLVRDYIPAIDENGVGFMFDKVSHTIYDNAGTGAFKYPAREVEYLKSSGTQYIDTGVKTTQNTSAEYQCLVINETGNTDKHIFGARTSATSEAFNFAWMRQNAFSCYRFISGSVNQDISFSSLDRDTILSKHAWYFSGTEIKLDGSVLKTFTTQSYTGLYNIWLFVVNNGGSAHTQVIGQQVYGCKIWANSVLVRDFIPCYKDGLLGMLDKVNSVFYQNAGTGTFSMGKIVEPDYE